MPYAADGVGGSVDGGFAAAAPVRAPPGGSSIANGVALGETHPAWSRPLKRD
jgi:hypothetical protein